MFLIGAVLTLNTTSGAQEAEIADGCDWSATCLKVFDGFISYIYKTSEQVNEDVKGTMAKAMDYSTKAMASWLPLGLSVTLKAHLSEDHVCNQMRDFKGIGDFNEDFVEGLRHDGVCTNWCMQTMRDRTKNYLHVAQWQEATQNPKVKEQQSVVNQKRKQKRQTSDDNGGRQLQLEERHKE